MKAARYVVKAGDTLWSIAGAHYGDPGRWPDLYAYNNRPDVVARGDRPIINPDRMVTGQAIFLPLPQARPAQRRAAGGRASDPLRAVGSGDAARPGGTALAPDPSRGRPGIGFGSAGAAALTAASLARNPAAEIIVNDFAHVFRLDRTAIEVRGATFSATLQLEGTVSLQRNARVPLVSYSSRTADTQARLQSAMLLGHLLSTQGTALGWHVQASEAAYDAALIREAGIRSPSTMLTEGVTERGQPVRTGVIVIPEFSGGIAGHAYIARDLRVHVALTLGQTPAPTRQVVPRDDRRSAGWDWAPALRRPDPLVVGAVLDESAVTPGNGLVETASAIGGAVAGRLGGAAATQFLNAMPTPVRISDGLRSAV